MRNISRHEARTEQNDNDVKVLHTQHTHIHMHVTKARFKKYVNRLENTINVNKFHRFFQVVAINIL